MLDELYNLIAEMIVYLINDEDKGFFKKYNSRTAGERKKSFIPFVKMYKNFLKRGQSIFVSWIIKRSGNRDL